MPELKHNFDLSGRNTFRMKVKCAAYLEISSEEELPLVDWDSLPKPLLVMGGGSNLLFRGDFPGTVVHVAIKGIGLLLSDNSVGSVTAASQPLPLRGPLPLAEGGDGSGTHTVIRQEPGECLVTAGAGVVFDDFCAFASERGLWGPENLSLIPGECGASAVQNIGAYGVEAKDIIVSIRAWDLQEKRFVDIPGADCAYGYRASRFKTEWKGRFIITSVTYRLWTEPHPVLDYGGVRKALPENAEITPQLLRDTIIGIRRKKLPDPEEIGSAGSFFCNPVISREHFERIVETARKDNGPDYQVPHYDVGEMVKVPAAWMIEQCGFKGAKLGGAQVYQNQPLVIVNASGNATPDEIVGLESRIIGTIQEKYGITLHPEVDHI